MIQQRPQPSSCSAPFLCPCISAPQSPAPLRTCASSPPIGSCLDALPNKALTYLQRSHYHLKLQKLEEWEQEQGLPDTKLCQTNKNAKILLLLGTIISTAHTELTGEQKEEQSTTNNWLAYQAMSMAYAVRVSRPSCLLMFLAASTTSCVVW